MQIKRRTWTENIAGANPEHQIYLDESGINTNLTRHYAHAVHGKRAIDAAPVNTPAGTTVLSSIRLNGSLVYTIAFLQISAYIHMHEITLCSQ